MSRNRRTQLIALAVLSWGAIAGSVCAGEYPTPELLPQPRVPAPRPAPQPGPGYYPRTPSAANELPPGYPPVDSSPSKTPIRDWYRHGRPLGCWASFNGYGCSSLKSELAFIFGSCRTFYAEPCLKGAPPSILPPWAGTESGYRGHPLPNENGPEKHQWLRTLKAGNCPNCQ